jgi:hypothetical protein
MPKDSIPGKFIGQPVEKNRRKRAFRDGRYHHITLFKNILKGCGRLPKEGKGKYERFRTEGVFYVTRIKDNVQAKHLTSPMRRIAPY